MEGAVAAAAGGSDNWSASISVRRRLWCWYSVVEVWVKPTLAAGPQNTAAT